MTLRHGAGKGEAARPIPKVKTSGDACCDPLWPPDHEVGPVLRFVLRTVPSRGDHLLFLEGETADGCGLIVQNEHPVAPDLDNAILRRRTRRGDDPTRPPNIDADPEIHGEVIGEVPVVDSHGR